MKRTSKFLSMFIVVLLLSVMFSLVAVNAARPDIPAGQGAIWLETSRSGNTLFVEVHVGLGAPNNVNGIQEMYLGYDTSRITWVGYVLDPRWDPAGTGIYECEFCCMGAHITVDSPTLAGAAQGLLFTIQFSIIGAEPTLANPLIFDIPSGVHPEFGTTLQIYGIGMGLVPDATSSFPANQFPPAEIIIGGDPSVTSITRQGTAPTIGLDETTAIVTYTLVGSDLDKLTESDFTVTFNNAIGFTGADLALSNAGATLTVTATGGQANTGRRRYSDMTVSWNDGPATVTTRINQDGVAADGGVVQVSQVPEVRLNERVDLDFVIQAPLGSTQFLVEIPANFTLFEAGAPGGWTVNAAIGRDETPMGGPGSGALAIPAAGIPGPIDLYVSMGRDTNDVAGATIFTINVAPTDGAQNPTAGRSIFRPFPVTFIDRFGEAIDISLVWEPNLIDFEYVDLTAEGDDGVDEFKPTLDDWSNQGGVEVIDVDPVLMGDVDENGRLTSADVAILARAISTPAFVNFSIHHANIGCNGGYIDATSERPNNGLAATRLSQWLVGSIPAADSGGWMCMLADRTTCINVFRPGFGPTIDDAITGLPAHVSAGCENRVITPDIFVPRPGFVYF